MEPRLLFIGSACADVVLRVPRIPTTGGDEHISRQEIHLGGCACNAFRAARHTGAARCELAAPVGTGLWGDWVREALRLRGIVPLLPPEEDENGCCYCLVEDGGERTFMSDHGAEYRLRRDRLEALEPERYDGVYVCGLELEEPTGIELLEAMEARPPRRLWFGPGPRIGRIPPERMARLLALRPVLHLNRDEALRFTGQATVEDAAALLHDVTREDVIVTLGAEGAYGLGAAWRGTVPGERVRVEDTIGAGDSHVGALMAYTAAGDPLREALRKANRISAMVVSGCGVDGWPTDAVR